MFDVESVDVAAACEAGHEFEPTHPLTGEPLGAFITVRGWESAIVSRHLAERARADAQRAAIARRRGQPAPELAPEEAEARAIELAVACTISWRLFRRGGAELAFSPEAARTWYAKHAWLGLQVIDEARVLGNFVPKPSANASTSPPISSS